MKVFRFKEFEVRNETSAMKVGTDGVLLGAAMTLLPTDGRLLDIGTGTGVVALLAAQRLNEIGAEFLIRAIDIDEGAAQEAKFNFKESRWKTNLEVQRCALQEYVLDEPLDCIFSNPPYYDESLRNPDERKSTARHSGSLSYREICAFAAGHLSPGGRLSLILPAEVRRDLLRCAASFGMFPFRIVSIRTTSTKPIKRIIAEFSLSARSGDCLEEEICLQEPNCTAKYYL